MAVVETRGTSSDNSVNEIQTMINAVAEAYPELKSNENYKDGIVSVKNQKVLQRLILLALSSLLSSLMVKFICQVKEK